MANSNKEMSDAYAKVLETSKKVARRKKIVEEWSEAVIKYDERLKEAQKALQSEGKTFKKMEELSTEETMSNAERIMEKCNNYITAAKERENSIRNLKFAETQLQNAQIEKSHAEIMYEKETKK